MKYYTVILIILIAIIIYGCHTQQESMDRPENESYFLLDSTERISQIDKRELIIPEWLYLENRVENCDSAMVFMRNVIEPCALRKKSSSDSYYWTSFWEDLRVRGESKSFFYQEHRKGRIIKFNNQRFYIAPSCLIGQSLQSVLDIFVQAEFHKMILDEIMKQEDGRNYYTIEATGFLNFTMMIADRKVADVDLGAVVVMD